MILQRETLWKMAAEGEKVDKEKVLPKDAQVVAFSITSFCALQNLMVHLLCAGDGGYFEGHGHQRL